MYLQEVFKTILNSENLLKRTTDCYHFFIILLANPFTNPSKQFFSCDLLGALISLTSTNRNGKETVALFSDGSGLDFHFPRTHYTSTASCANIANSSPLRLSQPIRAESTIE